MPYILALLGFILMIGSQDTAQAASPTLQTFVSSQAGVSISLPATMYIRDGKCIETSPEIYVTEAGMAATTKLEKKDRLYIGPSYQYTGTPLNKNGTSPQWKNCDRVELSWDTVDAMQWMPGHFSPAGWDIRVVPMKKAADILPLLRKEFELPQQCFTAHRTGSRNGVVDMILWGDNDPDSDCFWPPRLAIKYSPTLKKLAFWSMGYDQFCDANGDCIDEAVRKSFRFATK